ncbi:GntR family transcriptional regulator [Bordetella bronchiseptica]|uniref:GntR family transcriptional regulator n=1 Tax=Bordetella bronchiseptica TaxID=518 RepID=UPI00028A8284|nr:GntR family transcriptional regulator [Bordetella bronchiseptica]AUL17548.1 GntR family transcriptional regulator [Bordetella bronchiseptica]AWP60786.1 GntR family transcriptional regulator [Bordetella bronchiseptica]AZW33074.1 GntR family transcriptional regulator [Bordetella bronchiseptica]QET70041.1 GntR family transcriptional regulator [Bordetella bronchiseptica]QIY00616.1 GntR family transcriptional regulator [Bordetella bronchiseptica]
MNTGQPIETSGQETESGGRGLANQAYDALVDLILSRELKQGEQVQERALAQRLGVSRTPLREAMHRLEGEQMLERKSNNRLFVRQVTLPELMETLYIRRLLEGDAAGRAAGKVPMAQLADLRARIEALMLQDDSADPLHQILDAELHGLISEYCGNELMASMIANLRQKTRMFSLKRLERRMEPVCGEHMAMIDALARGDAQAASAETMRHIDNIRQSIIDKLSGSY